jgi:serine protease
MKRVTSPLCFALALCLSTATPLGIFTISSVSNAQSTSKSDELYYNFGDQRVLLSERKDSIAVSLAPPKRGAGGRTSIARLQDDFGEGPIKRGGGSAPASSTQIQSLNNNYALLTSLKDPAGGAKLKAQAQKKEYVSTTLPVLKIAGKSNSLILTNEMIVSFQANISGTQQKAILAQNQLRLIKELPFAQGFYKVTPLKAKGLEVLKVSNGLSKIKGVDSSMPNFIEVQSSPTSSFLSSTTNSNKSKDQPAPASLKAGDIKYSQWHIDSRPMMTAMGFPGSRTDVHAPEAWSRGSTGKEVVVAVIDNLIQWDHPALAGKVATIDCAHQQIACAPGEEHGWDWSSGEGGDNDTRINADEIATLQPKLAESLLSDSVLLAKYAPGITRYKNENPTATDDSILKLLRTDLRSDVARSFHGTMSAGMIAGASSNGFQGIAPNVKILPVRAGSLNGGLSSEAVLTSLAYAALRGADVINMSYGSDTPNRQEAKLIAKLHTQFPNLVFVASAGNENNATMGYPAGYTGVIAVGAINVQGRRAPYSNYGKGLDVVAPGGDKGVDGGVLTLSGVGANGFWSSANPPASSFAPFQDNRGYYVFTQGTSFSSPAVAGVVALMKSADPQRKLTSDQYRDILTATSSLEGLSLSPVESQAFTASGLPGQAEKFFFSSGLVNAEKAVVEVEKRVK